MDTIVSGEFPSIRLFTWMNAIRRHSRVIQTTAALGSAGSFMIPFSGTVISPA